MQESSDHLEILQSLRNEIDNIDEKIISLISVRFRVTGQVGALKAKHGLKPVDLKREAIQRQRYSRLAGENNVSEEIIIRLFRYLVDTVVANHIASAQAMPKSSYFKQI